MQYLKLVQKTKVQLFIIAFLTTLVYSNIFQNQFATDDIGYFYNWQIPKQVQNIPKMLTTDSVPSDEAGVYRPVKALAILIIYTVFGFNVFGYHLFSLIVHLTNTILVYFITRQVMYRIKNYELRIKGDKQNNNSLNTYPMILVPFLTALFFGLHPIHTEAVTFILASFDSLGLTFYLSAFALYLYSKRVQAVLFSLAAFFTYELTLSLPIAIIFYDFCFHKEYFKKRNLAVSFKRYLPFLMVLLFYLVVRFLILKIPARGEYLLNNPLTTWLVMAKAWLIYLKLLFFPTGLSLNHKIFDGVYGVVSKQFLDKNFLENLSIFNLEILFSLAAIISLFITAFKVYRKNPLLTFIIGWFFITLLPVMYILPQSSILAERYLYLSSVGYCLILGYGLSYFLNYPASKIFNFKFLIFNENFKFQISNSKLVIGCLLLVILFVFFYGIRTYFRNRDWKDTETVWSRLVEQDPKDQFAAATLNKFYQDQNPKFKIYQLQNISLSYPQNWLLNEGSDQASLTDPLTRFSVSLTLDQLGKEPFEDYYQSQTEKYGNLIQEGRAKIPNFEKALVKVWEDTGVQKLEFFLQKGSVVLKVLVYPADSSQMEQFDDIVGSIKFND